MSTKLIAAELATAAGVTTVVMHSEHVRDIFGVIQQDPNEDVDDGPLCTRFIRREQPINEWVYFRGWGEV
jgi:glutamate 5-kinase